MRQSHLFKKIIYWCLIIASALIAAYVAGVCIVSIWGGFRHMDRNGFWVPITFGGLTLCVGTFISFRFIRSIRVYMKDNNVLKH